jgi:hypothetical protein
MSWSKMGRGSLNPPVKKKRLAYPLQTQQFSHEQLERRLLLGRCWHRFERMRPRPSRARTPSESRA